MSARYLALKIAPELAGREVNTLLRRTLGLSGTVLRRVKWLEDGITLDGARVNVRARVREGQTLAVRLTGPTPTSGVVPADGPLDIVFEDPDLIVLNKAPGVLVHPGHGHFHDTLGNFLMYHYKMTGDESDFHPVHRLDKGTSGLLAVAKHPFAQEKLKGQLHTGGFRRTYLAVCDGAPPAPSGTVDAPIGPVDGSLMARRVRPDGKPARTHYRVVRSCGPRSLLELELETGRTHQIRVPHLPPRSALGQAGTGPPCHGGTAALRRSPAWRHVGTDFKGGCLMKKLRMAALFVVYITVLIWLCDAAVLPLPDWALRLNGISMMAGMAALAFATVRIALVEGGTGKNS